MREQPRGFVVDLRVRRDDEKQEWVLTEPLVWRGDWETLFIKPGFRTDFASVPRILRWLLDAGGRNAAAGVLHDVTWRESKHGDTARIDPWNADGLFRRALRFSGVAPVPRNMLWVGVRMAATLSGRIGKHLPPSLLGKLARTLMWAILALPVVVVPVAAIVIGYGVYLVVGLVTFPFTALYAWGRAKVRSEAYDSVQKLPRLPRWPSWGKAPNPVPQLVVIPADETVESGVAFDPELSEALETYLAGRQADTDLHWRSSEAARFLVDVDQTGHRR